MTDELMTQAFLGRLAAVHRLITHTYMHAVCNDTHVTTDKLVVVTPLHSDDAM